MKKFILIVIVLLIGAFFIFNLVASHQAENRIDLAIQMQADSMAYSVEYSSIHVSALAGNIDFSDLNIVRNKQIERAKHLQIDLRYIDFLNIYLGGIKYGLKNLLSANLYFKKISRINRQSLQQLSLGSLEVKYKGNLWNALQKIMKEQPLSHKQQIRMHGAKFRYSKSNSAIGNFKSDSVYFALNWPKRSANKPLLTDSLKFSRTVWTPPAGFQRKYSFFIQGFGFKQDSIHVPMMGFSSVYLHSRRLKINHGKLKTKLFTGHFNGRVIKTNSWKNAQWSPLHISVNHFSPEFKKVLQNMTKLLAKGKALPSLNNTINFKLTGTLSHPHIESEMGNNY